MKTLANLAAIVRQFEHHVTNWEQANKPIVQWNSQPRKAISESLVEEISKLAITVQDLDFDRDAYPLVIAIDTFIDACFSWAEEIRRVPADTDPQGGSKVWRPYQDVLRACTPKTFGRVEPINALIRLPNITHAQIATIYGWIDSEGRPEEWKVEQEIKNPGSVLDLGTWVSPDQKAYEQKIDEAWQKRIARIREIASKDPLDEMSARKSTGMLDRSKWTTPGIAPEPIEELLALPGITIQQVAEMKKITPEEVRAVAVGLRIPLDAGVMADIARGSQVSARDRIKAESEFLASTVNTYPDITAIDEKVWAMHDDGHSVGMILNVLKPANPGLTYKTLTEIVSEKPNVQRKPASRSRAKSSDDPAVIPAAVDPTPAA